jgi:hypothetical protein
MAATGTAVYPSTSLFPGSSVYPGQGSKPLLVCLYSTDSASVFSPNWTDATADVRAFTTSRGRDNELSRVDPGTARITLNNRDRAYDPAHVAAIRPMNRWWIRQQFAGSTNSIFLGYAHSYGQVWPDKSGVDAVAVVDCTDEFSRLAREKLPTTDPPRDSYQDLVMFDNPAAYYPLLNPNWNAGSPGEQLVSSGAGSALVTGNSGIVGQIDPGFAYHFGTGYFETNPLTFGSTLDVGGLPEFTIEAWIAISNVPSATEFLLRGPMGVPSTDETWSLEIDTSAQLVLNARNSSGTDHAVTSSALTPQAVFGGTEGWYHVVGTITGGNLRLYVNGAQVGSTAWSGSFGQIENEGSEAKLIIGNNGGDVGGSNFRAFDEVAFYKVGLAADRVLAHYNAGRNRGFPRGQDPGPRITAVLDNINSATPRSIRTGTRAMAPTYMIGQSPLDEMRRAESADSVDAVLFIAKDGTITFLDDGHRSSSPWNTVQATFDDDGTDLPYHGITLDYSTTYLANVVNVTRVAGTTSTVSDTASINAYGETPMSLSDLAIDSVVDQASAATALLAKYKDPFTRITNLDLLCVDDDLIDQVFRLLEIGSRIRVFRTPPGGGSRIDQTLFVQKIQVDANPYGPWRVNLAVSPL